MRIEGQGLHLLKSYPQRRHSKRKARSVQSRRSRRVIDLDDDTADVIRAHHVAQQERREFIGINWTETGYVFTNPTGNPHHPDNVSRAFTKFVRTLPVPYMTLHGLRDSRGTASPLSVVLEV